MPETKPAYPLPIAEGEQGLTILKGLLKERSLLAALSLMRQHVGPIFQITLPKFRPAVVTGPEPNRELLVSKRPLFNWRNETDPVTKLLRHGVLVVDGEEHDQLRALMDPPLHRGNVIPHIPDFWRYTNKVIDAWADGGAVDMLVEMRKVALLILMGTMFQVDFAPDMERLWQPILKAIAYISPGFWIVAPNMPRPGYQKHLAVLDAYLYQTIQERRAELENGKTAVAGDLLAKLIHEGLDDDLIRDQLLTMLIAGHDTSTALLAWVWYLLGTNPEAMAQAQAEVDAVFSEQWTVNSEQSPNHASRITHPGTEQGRSNAPTIEQINQLTYLDRVIKEALRLYPPIHIGNRQAQEDVALAGYQVPQDTRVMYSIYLSHRDERYWDEPEQFCPHRFDKSQAQPGERPPLTYIPFGGGPRSCIGAAFAQVESKVVLARILQRFDLELPQRRQKSSPTWVPPWNRDQAC
ncbi:MAG: cytochrome P450 [Chloroflexi bacterium]|nr:cytochrome P450 [Chloroflexota bacterium]